MSETHIVFNDQLELYGYRYITKVADIPKEENPSPEFQKKKVLALLFEQFLLFDKIALKIDRENLGLYFLINELGINRVEELLDHGIIIPVLWTPMIFTSKGNRLPDGSFDENSVIGQSPIIPGSLSGEDGDPEKNLDRLLGYFQIHKERKRLFKKKALRQYILPDNSIAHHSAQIVLDAYKNNRLENLGLKAEKEPEKLDLDERWYLFVLGNKVLETTVLAEKGFKSYDNYPCFNLTMESVKHIESAYHVSQNTSEIFKVENIANIQELVFENKIPFQRVFDIRYKKDIKAYRKWINTISENTDTKTITKEYIDEIVGKTKFSESIGGKFLRTVGMFGVGTGIGAVLANLPGAFAGGVVGKIADLGLAMLDTHVLDGLVKGWNPRMFVDAIKYESQEPAKLE